MYVRSEDEVGAELLEFGGTDALDSIEIVGAFERLFGARFDNALGQGWAYSRQSLQFS